MDYKGQERREKKFTFDPTINLGHIFILIGGLCTGVGAYLSIEKRVLIIEEKQIYIEAKLKENTASVKESLQEIKNDVKDMRRAVETVSGAFVKKVLGG